LFRPDPFIPGPGGVPQAMDFSPGQHGNAMGLPTVLSAVAAGAGSFVIASLDAGPLLALAWVAVSVAAALLARRALSPEAATPGLAGWLQRLRSGENVPPLEAGSLGPLASCAEDLNALAVGQRLRDVSLARLEVPLQRIPEGIRLARKGIDRSRESIEKAVEETASRMANINSSIRDINEEVESLSRSTAEASSSILQMGGAVEEVTRGTGALHESVGASSSSIHEITASIRQVAESADAVQGMAEESAVAMVQMDRAIHEVSQHASSASDLTIQVSEGAEAGSTVVSATVDDMRRIRELTEAAKTVLERLAERIGEIGEIVDVIGSINDETNLLSLNAAIIAAQAGEQGKPFAVVASHVKTLAQRTAGSTKEIEALIAAVQEESSNAVEAMGAGMEAVEAGVSRSRKAGEELLRIRDSAREASSQVAEIARATGEQTRNSKHVTEAAQRTSAMVQQITIAMAEQTRASENMLENVEAALAICSRVHRSTEEQRESGRFVMASISSISDMIQQIQRNTESHAGASEAVSEAVRGILETARGAGWELPEVTEALDMMCAEVENLLGSARDPEDPLRSFEASRPPGAPGQSSPLDSLNSSK